MTKACSTRRLTPSLDARMRWPSGLDMFPHSRAQLVGILVSAWFVLVCAVLSWHAVTDLGADAASLEWPRTHGRVTRLSYAGAPLDERTWGCPYEVYVTYVYTVQSSRFASSRVTRSRSFVCANESELTSTLERFRVGNDVTVYYCPDAPALGLLEPRVQVTDYLGLALFPLSLAVTAFMIRRRSRREASEESSRSPS